MNNNHGSSKTFIATAISVVVVVGIIFWIGNVLWGFLFHKNSAEDAVKSQDTTVVQQEDSGINNPHTIGLADVKNMSGFEFVEKYKGQWIQFDGLIFATNKPDKDAPLSTSLIVGDDQNQPMLQLSTLRIRADKATFADNLQEFSTANNTPYTTGKYPKVKVTARVSTYDQELLIVYLESRPNASGNTPSIVSR